jgi:hypothetical protein
MREQEKQKIYTLRHFLFYMGITVPVGAAIGVASVTMTWSSGLTFAVAVIAGTALCTFGLREGLFPSNKSQPGRRA